MRRSGQNIFQRGELSDAREVDGGDKGQDGVPKLSYAG